MILPYRSNEEKEMMFKEYRIDEIFDIAAITKRYSKNVLCVGGNIALVGADTNNNGIIGYCNETPTFSINKVCPFYLVFGDHTRSMNILEEDFCVTDNVKVLAPHAPTIEALLYVVAMWHKSIPNIGYARHWSIAKSVNLSLPSAPSGSPDWAYMEEYIKGIEKKYIENIKGIEKKYIEKLDGFLKEEGFERLTDEERAVLFEDKEMGEFALSSIVEKVSLKCLKKDFDKSRDTSKIRTDEFSLPLTTAATSNNGTVVYGRKEDFETAKMCIQILQNGDAGNVFIHTEEIGVLQDSYLVKPVYENYSEDQLLYIATAIQKKIKPLFSWHNKAGWNKIKGLGIVLPITSEGAPDYAFMDAYISAIKKKTISKTSKYTENRLKELEEITA